MKEDLLRDGRVIARGWWFEKLNIGMCLDFVLVHGRLLSESSEG